MAVPPGADAPDAPAPGAHDADDAHDADHGPDTSLVGDHPAPARSSSGRPVAGPGLRHRQRAVGTLLIAGGLLLGAAGLLGRPAVLLFVLVAQVVLVALGSRLLPSADRWLVIASVPAPLASLAVAAATAGRLHLGEVRTSAVLVAAYAVAALLVVITEVLRAAGSVEIATGEAHTVAVGPVAAGQGRVDRMSQNMTVAALAMSPALVLAVTASAAPRRWWFALGVAGVAAGFGVRLGGSIVRAGGLSAGELLHSPHRAAELLRLPVARAVGVDVAVSVLAAVATGALLAAGGVSSTELWLPSLLALAATPLVLAGATTVLGLRAAVAAGVLAVAVGLSFTAPVALLLSVRHR